jgi:hypothetical protein
MPRATRHTLLVRLHHVPGTRRAFDLVLIFKCRFRALMSPSYCTASDIVRAEHASGGARVKP